MPAIEQNEKLLNQYLRLISESHSIDALKEGSARSYVEFNECGDLSCRQRHYSLGTFHLNGKPIEREYLVKIVERIKRDLGLRSTSRYEGDDPHLPIQPNKYFTTISRLTFDLTSEALTKKLSKLVAKLEEELEKEKARIARIDKKTIKNAVTTIGNLSHSLTVADKEKLRKILEKSEEQERA